jgi:hypothetical protein
MSHVNGSKRVARMWKMMKEVVIKDLMELIKTLKKRGIWCILIDIKVSQLWLCNKI